MRTSIISGMSQSSKNWVVSLSAAPGARLDLRRYRFLSLLVADAEVALPNEYGCLACRSQTPPFSREVANYFPHHSYTGTKTQQAVKIEVHGTSLLTVCFRHKKTRDGDAVRAYFCGEISTSA
jgi:hypothetical protein